MILADYLSFVFCVSCKNLTQSNHNFINFPALLAVSFRCARRRFKFSMALF